MLLKVKTARIEPQLVSGDEIESIRKVIGTKITHRGILERDFLILDTMAMTGLRRGEIVSLGVGDLYFNDGKSQLMVKNGKGAKDRCIPLNPTGNSDLASAILIGGRPQCDSLGQEVSASRTGCRAY